MRYTSFMIREGLTEAVATAALKLYGVKVAPKLEYTTPEFGDFSTNLAFELAEVAKTSPAEVARELAATIAHTDVARVEASKNGFINITLKDSYYSKNVSTIASNYAQNSIGKGKQVQIEFISANPTGPLTMGNGRGGYNGDVLANILATSGYGVSREYYINDAGNQIVGLVESIRIAAGKSKGEPVYKGSYITELAERFKGQLVGPQEELVQAVTDYMLEDQIKKSTQQMGISFDVWLSEEKELHQTGKVKQILSKLKEAKLTDEKDGALWLKSDLAQDRERVLVKSDGSYSYLLVDIAYHWNKLVERKFDKVINLWGADHAGQVPSLQSALKGLGLEGRLEILLFQLVRLIKDGREYKVSKRAGTYVTVDELLEMVPTEVARFFFLMRSRDTQMDFDLDVAREQSQKNPYYYVMYTHARAHSILKQAKQKELKIDSKISDLTGVEKLLIKQLLQLPELVAEVARDYQVHKLTFYGIEVAKLFHEWYESARIIDLDPAVAGQKLYLLQQYIVAMEVYWGLLGIKPQESM